MSHGWGKGTPCVLSRRGASMSGPPELGKEPDGSGRRMQHILTLNAGSSSIKFALFASGPTLDECVRGQIEGLGSAPQLQAEQAGKTIADERLDAGEVVDQASALAVVLRFLEHTAGEVTVAAVGHRVVHGGVDFSESVVLDEERFKALERLNPLAPLHQPYNLLGVRAAQSAFADA